MNNHKFKYMVRYYLFLPFDNDYYFNPHYYKYYWIAKLVAFFDSVINNNIMNYSIIEIDTNNEVD